MKLRCENFKLYAVNKDGAHVLVGQAEKIDLQVEVSDQGHAQFTYQYPQRTSNAAISIDITKRQAQVMFRDKAWECLRLQAKRKGRPGWRQLQRKHS